MKRRLLTVAILSALSLSTISVYAAPTFSGDSSIEYNKIENSTRSFTDRIRLNIDNPIDDIFSLHARIRFDNNIDTNSSAFTSDKLFVNAKLQNFDIKAGKIPIWLGKGLLADTSDLSGNSGLQVDTKFDNTKLMVFYGRDYISTDNTLAAADVATSFNNVNFGASYMKNGDNKFWGVNADTKIMDNAVFNAEYVKNTNSRAKGYWAGVKIGNAAKRGELDYTLNYRNIEPNAIDNNYASQVNYADSKGFEFKSNYRITDNTKLGLIYDLAKDNAGVNTKHRTDVKFTLEF